jgi:hypothetical protein
MAMSSIGRQPSAWQEMQNWRTRRSASSADALNASDTFSSMFLQANTTKIEGLAQLAGEAALKRINAAAKLKFDQIANTKVPELDEHIVDKTV